MSIQNVGQSLVQLLNEGVLFLPRLVLFALILLVGSVIARLLRRLLTRGLHLIHFAGLADRAGISRMLALAGTRWEAAAVLAALGFWWIFLAFVEVAVTSLGLTERTAFLNSLLGYLPNVFVAILILIAELLVANVVAGVVRGAGREAQLPSAPLLASVARWAIVLLAVLAALPQLRGAENSLLILCAALVGLFALAGGLALGLGGETARSLVAGEVLGGTLRPGQRVQIGEQTGMVVRHDLSTTRLETRTGQVAIPHAHLAPEPSLMLGSDGKRASKPVTPP